MTISNNISPIIQKFMMNEINEIIQKYNNVQQEQVANIESLLDKINDEEFKEELLKDFDKALELARELGATDISTDEIKMYLWLIRYINKEIQISEFIRYSKEVESNGYVELDKTSIIYKKGYCLKDLAREKLEYMLEDEYFVDKLLDKDSLIEYWMNGTSKDDVIEELVNGIEIEELLDFSMDTIMINEYGEKYIHAELDC
ncbi:hypothetical protein [uncultured Clostridium sp.]|uniref:hypothetical protein n=1 Tax=uncultured Clostridium sp. TaxID=59620 RepID=UPI0025D03EDE|nr:hypothetical protein [uncultured Clostridium sp.]